MAGIPSSDQFLPWIMFLENNFFFYIQNFETSHALDVVILALLLVVTRTVMK